MWSGCAAAIDKFPIQCIFCGRVPILPPSALSASLLLVMWFVMCSGCSNFLLSSSEGDLNLKMKSWKWSHEVWWWSCLMPLVRTRAVKQTKNGKFTLISWYFDCERLESILVCAMYFFYFFYSPSEPGLFSIHSRFIVDRMLTTAITFAANIRIIIMVWSAYDLYNLTSERKECVFPLRYDYCWAVCQLMGAASHAFHWRPNHEEENDKI